MIPKGVTKIEECAFGNCAKLSDVTIPEGVRVIESGVFSSCDSLESIVIPDGVTDIGEEVFCGCSDLEEISIPDSVICIGAGAFDDTAWLDNQIGALVYAGKELYDYIEDISCIRGKYYLYACSSKYDPVKKRAKKITGEYLGRITEEGLIPPKRKKDRIDSVTVNEFGASKSCSSFRHTS